MKREPGRTSMQRARAAARENKLRAEGAAAERERIAKALEQEAEGLAALAREGRGDPVVLRANSIYARDLVARIRQRGGEKE